MRNLLYVVGLMCVIFGALKVYDANQLGDAFVSMLVVVCGAVFIGSAAIVGAIDALRPAPTFVAPQPAPPQWIPPT